MQRLPESRKRARSELSSPHPHRLLDAPLESEDTALAGVLRRSLSALRPRPRVVPPDDKAAMLRVLGACGGDAAAAARLISSRRGF